jgi:predicted esterase
LHRNDCIWLLFVASACTHRRVEPTRAEPPDASTPPPVVASAPAPPPEPPPPPPHVEPLPVPADLPASIVRTAPGAPPRVVFLPGVCSNAAAYLAGFPQAAAGAGGVVAIDGDQTCPGAAGFRTFTFNVEKQHRRIDAALTASGVTQPAEGLTVIGYSQGAAILEHLAAKYPERYARIVIISPPSDPMPGQYKASRAVVTMSCSRDVPARMKAAAKAVAALGVPSTYIEMPGCTHGNLADAEATFTQTFAWLDEHAL